MFLVQKKGLSRMKIKRHLISCEEAENRAIVIKNIERKLVLRLKVMAYFFFVFSLISFAFAFFIHGEKQNPSVPLSLYKEENSFLLDIEAITGATLFSDMESLELAPQDIFNFYIVSCVFASIGIALFHFSSTVFKKSNLPNSMPDSKMQFRE